jgi:phosphoglycolate phosphatase-like HAD superfamily hydrolase
MPKPTLILDFDGVVCDALEECALVTWLGMRPPAPRMAVSTYLTAMPRAFVERFRKVRDYARLLDHFLVAHRPAAANIHTKNDFEALFGALGMGYVADFVATASAVRERCRTEEPEFWLDLHTLYPGIPDLLRRHAGAVCVVTAKDEESVWTILDRHGLAPTVAEVIGECGQKADAVRDLCARHGTTPDVTTFIDDNLTNVQQVARTGARAYWAMWGYHTPDDLADADRIGVRKLELAAVPSFAA